VWGRRKWRFSLLSFAISSKASHSWPQLLMTTPLQLIDAMFGRTEVFGPRLYGTAVLRTDMRPELSYYANPIINVQIFMQKSTASRSCRDPETFVIHFWLPGGVRRRPQRFASAGSGGGRDTLRPPPLLLRPLSRPPPLLLLQPPPVLLRLAIW